MTSIQKSTPLAAWFVAISLACALLPIPKSIAITLIATSCITLLAQKGTPTTPPHRIRFLLLALLALLLSNNPYAIQLNTHSPILTLAITTTAIILGSAALLSLHNLISARQTSRNQKEPPPKSDEASLHPHAPSSHN